MNMGQKLAGCCFLSAIQTIAHAIVSIKTSKGSRNKADLIKRTFASIKGDRMRTDIRPGIILLVTASVSGTKAVRTPAVCICSVLWYIDCDAIGGSKGFLAGMG